MLLKNKQIMAPESVVKVTCTRVYEYDVSQIHGNLSDRGFVDVEMSEDLIKTTATDMAIAKLSDDIMHFEGSIDDFIEATAEIVNDNDVYRGDVNNYALICWPESQEFMEESWFKEEAILALGFEDITGDSAYFIPIKRIKE